jgi:hypothetical protein
MNMPYMVFLDGPCGKWCIHNSGLDDGDSHHDPVHGF